MNDTPRVGVIVVAAGSGTRLGIGVPKAFAPLGAGTVLERSLRSVFAMAESAQVVVVVPGEQQDAARALCTAVAGAASGSLTVVAGGRTRQESVAAGLAQLAPGVETVLVHDSARALTPTELFERVIAKVRETGEGVVPVLPVVDTLKRVEGGLIAETVDRSALSIVQTPQGFPRWMLETAYARAAADYTDDAALYAAAGHAVRAIEGDALAFKITIPWDLRRAELADEPARASASASGSAASGSTVDTASARIGLGIDVHAFDDRVALWLGGVHWPDEPGLAGHSDGDAIAHAICDSLLSAAGLGDIGSRFGTSDPRFAGAHGEVFLRETVALLNDSGYRIQNVAVQVVANRPKIGPRRAEIEALLSRLVGAAVSVSATTSDGLGFTGRGEGLTAIATAMIHAVGTLGR